jgi:DNA-binding NtrC family response regulator
MAALAVAAPRHGIVGPSLLPAAVARAVPPPTSRLDEARQAFERRFVAAALARAGHRTGPAARSLGISRQGLVKMMKRLGLGKVLQ